ncbi:MAG: GNAT family N-acetyltransferase [Acidimicrobiia bacterium]|nr:GNAT family N-acetyltransferase [Acidimicrobiia bacterium]
MRCRPAGDDDVAVLADLRRAWTEEDAGAVVDDPGYGGRFDAFWAAEALRRTHWIAELDGEGVGMASVVTMARMPQPGEPDSAWGYVHHLYVRPGCRDRGVGRALLDAVVAEARQRGFHQLLLNPRPRSLPFYRRSGFVSADHLLVLPLSR